MSTHRHGVGEQVTVSVGKRQGVGSGQVIRAEIVALTYDTYSYAEPTYTMRPVVPAGWDLHLPREVLDVPEHAIIKTGYIPSPWDQETQS